MFRVPSYIQTNQYGIYYFRIAIPQALQVQLGKKEIKRSLRTSNRRSAVQLAREWKVKADWLFSNLDRETMDIETWASRRKMLDDEYLYLTQIIDKALNEKGPIYSPNISNDEDLDTCLTVEYGLAPRSERFPAMLKRNRVELDNNHYLYKTFNEEYEGMCRKFLRDIYDYSHNKMSAYIPPQSSVKLPVATEESTISISVLVDEYCSEKLREGAWTPKTEQENKSIYALLVKIAGDIPVNSVGYQHARDYKKVLQQLPPNINKSPLYCSKSIEQVLALKPEQTMSVSSINKGLGKY
ncbi:MAG: hypothetical protein KKA54_12250 [Proteobacteria bacterium]|nr:hypothetical protein [Pseudomonadota bacterium]MBU0967137.1 hypothetical protein [Pseudomonadota bacterium]